MSIYLLLVQEQQTREQQINAAKSGAVVVAQINHKLDTLHNESQKLISEQGNISSAQRQAIIKEFTDIESQGGLATKLGQADNNHKLKEILGNVTELVHNRSVTDMTNMTSSSK
jgi:hypothetical protein